MFSLTNIGRSEILYAMRKLILVLAFFFICTTTQVFAQEKISTDAALLSPTPTPFDYQLPYPGLLPDNPLYFLKIFRDRIIDFLVSNPLKKAELNLLQADKRLSAGQALFAKGEKDLAESTISKGENYFESGIGKLQEAKKQGMDVSDLTRKFSSSIIIHKQIVRSLIQESTGGTKQKLQVIEKRILEFEKQVSELRPK